MEALARVSIQILGSWRFKTVIHFAMSIMTFLASTILSYSVHSSFLSLREASSIPPDPWFHVQVICLAISGADVFTRWLSDGTVIGTA